MLRIFRSYQDPFRYFLNYVFDFCDDLHSALILFLLHLSQLNHDSSDHIDHYQVKPFHYY